MFQFGVGLEVMVASSPFALTVLVAPTATTGAKRALNGVAAMLSGSFVMPFTAGAKIFALRVTICAHERKNASSIVIVRVSGCATTAPRAASCDVSNQLI